MVPDCHRKIFPVLPLLDKIGSNRLRGTFHPSNDNYYTNLIIQQNAFLNRFIAWCLKTEYFKWEIGTIIVWDGSQSVPSCETVFSKRCSYI